MGAKFVHGEIGPGSALMIPAGWLTALTTCDDDSGERDGKDGKDGNVSGASFSFLPTQGLADIAPLLASLKDVGADPEWISTVLDIISLHRPSVVQAQAAQAQEPQKPIEGGDGDGAAAAAPNGAEA